MIPKESVFLWISRFTLVFAYFFIEDDLLRIKYFLSVLLGRKENESSTSWGFSEGSPSPSVCVWTLFSFSIVSSVSVEHAPDRAGTIENVYENLSEAIRQCWSSIALRTSPNSKRSNTGLHVRLVGGVQPWNFLSLARSGTSTKNQGHGAGAVAVQCFFVGCTERQTFYWTARPAAVAIKALVSWNTNIVQFTINTTSLHNTGIQPPYSCVYNRSYIIVAVGRWIHSASVKKLGTSGKNSLEMFGSTNLATARLSNCFSGPQHCGRKARALRYEGASQNLRRGATAQSKAWRKGSTMWVSLYFVSQFQLTLQDSQVKRTFTQTYSDTISVNMGNKNTKFNTTV